MTEQKQRRKPRRYTDEFKQQLVDLYRSGKRKCDESKVENILDRQSNGQGYRDVVVSGLTYVRVGRHWDYICVFVDLSNREIIGHSAGEHKTAELVRQAFMSVEGDLSDIHMTTPWQRPHPRS